MVSVEQLTALIEFMESHTEVALGRLNRSKEGCSQTKRLWEECAGILNTVSADCVSKTPDQWRVYYNEYKSKLTKKIKIEKVEIKATGGGPSKVTPLTPFQERLYDILGRDFGEPLQGIRHNPLR
ncbi:hypothetical protein ABMA27_003411 [Loxostege sticticalis]|uniref:Regulatory protein zeste n=1 Tax=Loxostege sticticalis TaxID=481309 RepID=A0ABR3HT05_LOXSC